ncbi:MAG: 6-bladed beta-propeller [Bacteroidales bacterium]|nr:6-bladed beta-propeller [Bacteroidales bacterium]
MKKLHYLILCFCLLLFCQCNSKKEKEKISSSNSINVDFGDLSKTKSSIISIEKFIRLETNAKCLIQQINQIEIFNDKIYLMDDFCFYSFSLEGKFLGKIDHSGVGPGEFMAPYSFWIDNKGGLYILDLSLNKLLKYNLDNFTFIEDINMPYVVPQSFCVFPGKELFSFYYSLSSKRDINQDYQIFIADKAGKIKAKMYQGNPSGKICHGTSTNFYLQNNKMRVYPYFSNKIYTLSKDTIQLCYSLSFGKYSFPDEKLFTKYDNSGDIMKEIWTGSKDWIRLMYVYETDDLLAVKYYIKKDFYVGFWDKRTKKSTNFKYNDVEDDLGIGGKFPLPMGRYKNMLIGTILPFDMDMNMVRQPEMKKLMQGITEESNPILVLYSVKLR